MKRQLYLFFIVLLVLFVALFVLYKQGRMSEESADEGNFASVWSQVDEDKVMDFKAFFEVVKANPEMSMTTSFERLVSESGLQVLDSKDGQLRIYGCEYPFQGTMGVYGTIVQYRWEGEIRFHERFPTIDDVPCMPVALYTLEDGKYLLVEYSREAGFSSFYMVTAFELCEFGLVAFPVFKIDGNLDSEIFVNDYTESRVFWPGNTREWDNTSFDEDARILSVVEDTIEGTICEYQWNGEKMVPLRKER